MDYTIKWAKQLSDADLAYIEFIVFYIRHHHKLRYSAIPEQSIRLMNSDVNGYTTVVIRLNQERNGSGQRMFNLKNADAQLFYSKFCNDFVANSATESTDDSKQIGAE